MVAKGWGLLKYIFQNLPNLAKPNHFVLMKVQSICKTNYIKYNLPFCNNLTSFDQSRHKALLVKLVI